MKSNFIRNLNLQQKILILVLGGSAIVYVLALGISGINTNKTLNNTTYSSIDVFAQKYSKEIKYQLEQDMIAARTLANSVLSYKSLPKDKWKDVFAKMYEQVITDNPNFLSIWDSWELKNIDSSYRKDYGRYVCEYYRENGKIKTNRTFKSMDGDAAEYARIKKDKIESLENPYFYSFTGNAKDQILMTSVVVPIMERDKFIGVVGIDISLNNYQPFINQIKPYKNSYAFIISNDFKYIAHPTIEKIGTDVLIDYESLFSKFGITSKIASGEQTTFTAKDVNGINSLFTIKPIIVERTNRPWSFVLVVPQTSILEQANRNRLISIIIGIIGLIVLSSIVYLVSKTNIIEPIQKVTNLLKQLAKGQIGDSMYFSHQNNDEVGQMADALNTSISELRKKAEFAKKIGQGDLNSKLNLLGDDDALGKSLINMQESLKKAKSEEDFRKIEDDKRSWTNEGLAKFSEILRQNNDKFEVLSSEIIKNLVDYLNANQGGLFVYNDEDPDFIHFELASAFAYNRQKFLKKEIIWGEGLIGACAIEKQTIYYTEIPENYIQITSGLGESRPRALLIVPLMIEEKVLGIIELASFSEIEQHQIEFVEKIAQSIASTLTTVRTNIKTASLLAKTQQQAEEMSAQEEEMRQNMEELQATQEEAARKSAEMQNYIDALNNSSFVIEYDAQGYIIAVNNAYIELLGIPKEQLVGTHHSLSMEQNDQQKVEYEKFWNDLRQGLTKKVTNKFTVKNKLYSFEETYTPMKDEQGAVYKIIKIANNVQHVD